MQEDGIRIGGNGQKALQELATRYNKIKDEVVRATMERLANTAWVPAKIRATA